MAGGNFSEPGSNFRTLPGTVKAPALENPKEIEKTVPAITNALINREERSNFLSMPKTNINFVKIACSAK